MTKKKIAAIEPVSAGDGTAAAPAKAPKATAKVAAPKARAPRASAKPVTHKHKKTTIAAVPAEPAGYNAPTAEPAHEEIARLAYSYWEARGYQGGSQQDDWLRAVDELRNR